MPSKDMSEILSRCRTGDSAAQEPLAGHYRSGGDCCCQRYRWKSWESTIVNRLATYLPIILLPEIEFRTMR